MFCVYLFTPFANEVHCFSNHSSRKITKQQISRVSKNKNKQRRFKKNIIFTKQSTTPAAIRLILQHWKGGYYKYKHTPQAKINSSIGHNIRAKHITEAPYSIKGVWYRPLTSYVYDEVGYASCYGADCHGKKTALGDRFNMYAFTAASRVLPLPSVVLVRNLVNGRQIKVLINDRGPFADTRKRIIDLSKKSAQALGLKGLGPVRVICLPTMSRKIARLYKKKHY